MVLFSKRQKWIRILIEAIKKEPDPGRREKLEKQLDEELSVELLMQKENYYTKRGSEDAE